MSAQLISVSGRRWAWAALAGLALLLGLHTGGRLLRLEWMTGLAWLVPAAALAAWASMRRRPEASEAWGNLAGGISLVIFLVLYLFSSAAGDPWFYFLGWVPSGDVPSSLWVGVPARLFLLAAILTPVLLYRRTSVALLVLLVLLSAQLLAFSKLIWCTGGEALYRDDHPSFLFRLWVFGRSFPRLVSYNPFWNGGLVSAHVLSTGTVSVGSVLWPLWRFAPLDLVYTPAIGFLFIFLVPVVAGVSVRVAGGSVLASLCGAILGIGVNQAWFLWLLHFGTLGAVFSAAFAPLVVACVYRVIWLDRTEIWTGALLVLSLCVFISWPLSVLFGVPVALGALTGVRRLTPRKVIFLVACAAVVVLLFLPTLLGLLLHSQAVGFVKEGVEDNEVAAPLTHGWAVLCGQVRQGHPLLVFLGLAGVFFLGRGWGGLYAPIILGLAFLTGWGEIWKPQLQLTRAAIPLFFVAIIPAALWLGSLLESRAARLAPVRGVLLALLLIGGWNCSRFYGNGGSGTYATYSGEIPQLVDWLRKNVPDQGRVLFAGRTVHAYGKGHVAFLPVLTGREMMACDYYHFSPARVEYDYPPEAFRDSDEGIFHFMDLYNITHVVTYHDSWTEYCRNRPARYQQVFTYGAKRKKTVFRVLREPSFFERGRGRVEADLNVLRVTVDDPSEEVVLRYNWADGLAADPPVDIRPFDAGKGIRLIAARPNGQRHFSIEYRRWL